MTESWRQRPFFELSLTLGALTYLVSCWRPCEVSCFLHATWSSRGSEKTSSFQGSLVSGRAMFEHGSVSYQSPNSFHVAGLCQAYSKVSLDWEPSHQATCLCSLIVSHIQWWHCVTDEHFVLCLLASRLRIWDFWGKDPIDSAELLRDSAIGSSFKIFCVWKFRRIPTNNLNQVTSKFKGILHKVYMTLRRL